MKDAKTDLERPSRSCKDTVESFQGVFPWNIIDGPIDRSYLCLRGINHKEAEGAIAPPPPPHILAK